MRPARTFVCVLLNLVLFAVNIAAADLPAKAKSSASPAGEPPSTHSVVQKLGSLPLRFEPNQGQSDARVKYLAHGPGYTLFLTKDEAVLALAKPMARTKSDRHRGDPENAGMSPPQFETSVVRMRLVGSNRDPMITPASPQPGVANYFLGNDRKKWRTGIPGYGRVDYHAIYPGIDVVFYGNPQRLEYDFTAAPGADPAKIQLAFDGADAIEKSASGDLLLHTGSQIVTIHKPLVYQADMDKPIDAQFVLRADNRVGFVLGAYDHSQSLTIDPVLTYSSYIGGSVFDTPHGIRLDPQGNIVLSGVTQSSDFPIVGGYQSATLHGNSDIFVAKLEPLGRFLIYSTFVGGSDNDGDLGRFTDNGLAVDTFGNVYVAEPTTSLDFPIVNAVQPAYGGGTSDGAVFELSSDGKTLMFSTYLGGSGGDASTAIALDAAGDIIVGGSTSSADFPTVNPLETIAPEHGIYHWAGDPWVELSNNGLNVRVFTSVAVDPSNHAVLYAATGSGGVYKSTDGGAHWSASGLTDLSINRIEVDPVTPTNVYAATNGGVFKSTDSGSTWAFLSGLGGRNTFAFAVNPELPSVLLAGTSNRIFHSQNSGLTWSAANGFSGAAVNKLTIDPTNSARVYAATNSGLYLSVDTGLNWIKITSPLPNSTAVAVDPFNSSVLYAGSRDTTGFQGLYKSTDGGATWAQISGATVRDVVTSPAHANTVYMTAGSGLLRTSDAGASFNPRELGYVNLTQIAVVGGEVDTLYAGTGGGQGFVTKLSPGGGGIVYSTYIPASRNIYVQAVASDPAGNAVAAGASGADQSVPFVNAFQTVNHNGDSCYVARINPSGSAFVYSTLLGGSTGYAECRGVAADSAGNAYVTGSTGDTDFPLLNPVQAVYGGGPGELFITKFSPAGAVLYSTYWGGAGDEDGQALFVDSFGNLYLTGDTGSTNFPLVNPTQEVAGFSQNDSGAENAVVMKLNSSGQVVFATYLGGSSGGFDGGRGIVANSTGDIYVTGTTTSSNFPLAGPSFQTTDNTLGNGTGFISKIAFFPPAVLLSSTHVDFGPVTQNLTSPPQIVTLTNTGTGPLHIEHHALSGPVNPGSPFFYNTTCGDVVPVESQCSASFTFTPPSVGIFNDQLTITDDAADSPQIITFTGTGVETFAAAMVTPSALHFGNVGVNFTSPGQNVTITSTGTAPLLFNSFTTSDAQFAISNNTCPASLNPGLSCTVTVTVTPAETGVIAGNLIISDNTVTSPQLVSLDANGTQSITVTQPLSPTDQNTFTFPGQTFTYGIQFPPGTNFSGVNASVTAAFSTTADFQTRVTSTFPGAQCIVYDGSGGSCTVFQIKCTPSPCPSSGQPNIIVKTAFDSSQPIINPGFLQAESGSNSWHNIFTEFLLPKIDGTIKGGTDGFSDFAAVNLPLPPGVQAGTFMSFLAPLAPKNGRVFSVGDTIPVKFQVAPVGANTSVFPYKGPFVTNAAARLTLVQGTFERTVKLANNHGTPPNIFKYNSVLNAYEFYLDTTGLPAGQYQLTVFSNSFPAQQVTFTLQ